MDAADYLRAQRIPVDLNPRPEQERKMLGRVLWQRVVLALVALSLAVGTYLVPRRVSVEIGAGHDGNALLGGFHRPSTYEGRRGRVIDGIARVRLQGVGPYPALVRIAWSAEERTEGIGLEVSAGSAHTSGELRGPGTQLLKLRVQYRDENDLVVVLKPKGTQRLRVERISVETGGIAGFAMTGWWQAWTPLRTGGATILLIAGTMALASAGLRLVADVRTPVRIGATLAAGILTSLVLVLFRFELIHLVVPASILVGIMSAAVATVSHRRVASRLAILDDWVLACRPRVAPFAALALGLVVALLGTGILRGHVVSQADILSEFYPWRAYATGVSPVNAELFDIPQVFYPALVDGARAVRSGTMPLWNPRISAGHPSLASFTPPVFSPFTAIAYLQALPQATVSIAVAVLIVGALGMFVLVRSWGFGWPASTFAGVAYLLNPFAVLWLDFALAAVAAWIPWLLWATERLVRRRRAIELAVLAGVVALLLVCGHPETAFKAILLGGLYGLWLALRTPRRWGGLALIAAGYAGGLLLSGIQVLPYLEYIQNARQIMVRQTTEVNAHFAPFATIITAFVPNFFGNPVDRTYLPVENRYGQPATIFDHILFPGGVTWLLAAVGLAAAWRNGAVRFFAGAAIVAAAVMFAPPGLIEVLSVMPLFRIAALSRFGQITIVCVILLAAFGVEALARRGTVGGGAPKHGGFVPDLPRAGMCATPAAVTALLAVAMIVVWCVGYVSWVQHGAHAGLARRYSVFEVSILVAGVGLIISRARRRLAASLFVLAMLLLLAIDLLAFGKGFRAVVPPERVLPALPEAEAIRADPDVFRVGGRRYTMVPNTAAAYGLQDFRGYIGIGHQRYGGLIDPSLDYDGFLRVPGVKAPDFSDRFESPWVLDLLNVKYVFVEPGYPLPPERYSRLHVGAAPLYRNDRVFPRAFLADSYRVIDDEAMLRTIRTGDVDLRRTVLLEAELPRDFRPEAAAPTNGPGTATIRHYGDHVVEIETQAVGKRLLFLGDVHYPGWKAYLDGRRIPIYRANYALRAVPVPAGLHLVRFAYDPLSFTVGAGLSLLAGLGLIGFVAIDWYRGHRKSAVSDGEDRAGPLRVRPGAGPVAQRLAEGLSSITWPRATFGSGRASGRRTTR